MFDYYLLVTIMAGGGGTGNGSYLFCQCVLEKSRKQKSNVKDRLLVVRMGENIFKLVKSNHARKDQQ